MKSKKLVSILLTALVLLGALPLSAFAASPVLALDTPLTLIPGADTAEATFTPTETGVYEFRSESVNDAAPADPDLILYDADREIDALAGDVSWNGNQFYLAYCLEGGKTYTLAITDELSSHVGMKVTATKPEVKSLAMNTPVAVVPGDEFAYVTFTPDKDGEYTFASAGDDADPYLRQLDSGGDDEYDFISGEQDDYNELQFWASYKLHDGYTYTLALSDYTASAEGFTVTVMNYHELLTQPTAGEPTVTVTTPEKATFQWNQVDMVTAPVTESSDLLYDIPLYDNGQWIGEDRGEEDGRHTYWLMDVQLKAGEELTVKSADKISVDYSAGYGYAAGQNCEVKAVDANTVRFTAPADMPYSIMVVTDGEDDRFTVSHGAFKLGAKIDGQTGATLTKFEKNKYYACVITYPDGVVLTTDFFKMKQTVAKQPTIADPSVAVTFPEEVKSYQWYKMNINKTTPLTPDKVAGYPGTYNASTGEWTGDVGQYDEDEYGHDLFAVSLVKGQTLIIEGSDSILLERSYFYGNNVFFGTMIQLTPNAVAFTALADDTYTAGVVTNSDKTTFKAWIGSLTMGDAVSGQTTATLTDYDKDAAYVAKVTYGDGVQLTSDIVVMHAAIVKQPTASDPTVKVNSEEEVKSYQWYTYEKAPITLQNAKVYEYDGEKATFNAATDVWTGVEDHWGYGDHGYFVIDLKKEDQVLVDLGGELLDYVGIEDMAREMHYLEAKPTDTDHQYLVKADEDGSYYLYVSEEDTAQAVVKAWLLKAVPVAGEVKAELQKAEAGKTYFCEITYKDGDKLISDSLKATKTTGLVIDAAAADDNDKEALQAVLDKVNEQLKDKELTEDEKKVLAALKAEIEKKLAAIEQAEANQKPAGGVPNTGVADNAWLWLALMLTALGGVVTTLLLARKKQTA